MFTTQSPVALAFPRQQPEGGSALSTMPHADPHQVPSQGMTSGTQVAAPEWQSGRARSKPAFCFYRLKTTLLAAIRR